MGKATNPAAARVKRQAANDDLVSKGNVESINGVSVNHGGSPLQRWKATKQLSASQELAIEHCLRLWDLAGIKEPATTAAYGERIPGNGRPDPEWVTAQIIDAKDDLRRIEGYFRDGARKYWQVFENCIRYDEPAGRVGSRIMGWSDRQATNSARLTVQFVADIVCMNERLVA